MALESHNSQRSADWDIIRAAYRVLASVSNPTLAWAQGRAAARFPSVEEAYEIPVGCATAGKISRGARSTEPHTTATTPNPRAALHARGGTATSPGRHPNETLYHEAGAADNAWLFAGALIVAPLISSLLDLLGLSFAGIQSVSTAGISSTFYQKGLILHASICWRRAILDHSRALISYRTRRAITREFSRRCV
jgi:hypothetical protein